MSPARRNCGTVPALQQQPRRLRSRPARATRSNRRGRSPPHHTISDPGTRFASVLPNETRGVHRASKQIVSERTPDQVRALGCEWEFPCHATNSVSSKKLSCWGHLLESYCAALPAEARSMITVTRTGLGLATWTRGSETYACLTSVTRSVVPLTSSGSVIAA